MRKRTEDFLKSKGLTLSEVLKNPDLDSAKIISKKNSKISKKCFVILFRCPNDRNPYHTFMMWENKKDVTTAGSLIESKGKFFDCGRSFLTIEEAKKDLKNRSC